LDSTHSSPRQPGIVAPVLVTAQIIFFLAGAVITILWIGWNILPRTWWATLSVVGILLLSLLIFSVQETRFGLSKKSRERSENPDSMGGPLELIAFISWLFLIVNMVVTVFRVIRTIKAAL